MTRCRRFAARSLFRCPFPPSPYRRLSYVVFVVGTIEDGIRGVQNVVANSMRSHRGEHTLLPYPKVGNRLNCCHQLIKKDRGRILYLIGGGGRGAEKIECPILFSGLPPPPPLPTFYFAPPPLGRPTCIPFSFCALLISGHSITFSTSCLSSFLSAFSLFVFFSPGLVLCYSRSQF